MGKDIVIVKSKSMIKPAPPTPQPCKYALSNFDLVTSCKDYATEVFYYKRHESITMSNVIPSLKESLAKTLHILYVLAGRVEEASNGKMEVNCNDSGVLFVEAVADASFEDWDGDMTRSSTIQPNLFPNDTFITDVAIAPPLRVQVTRFNCGGISVAFNIWELLVDGFSANLFIKTWSEMHAGQPISQPCYLGTHLLQARNPPCVNVPIRDYIVVQPKKELAKVEYVQMLFDICPESIDKAVMEIQNGPHMYGHVTAFEAISSIAWKAITQARNLPNHVTTTFCYPYNLRVQNRWSPPLPENYFGNAAHVVSLPAMAREIKSNHVSYTAKLIHDDIINITLEDVQSSIDWMEIQLRQKKELNYNIDYYSGADIHNTILVNFPSYQVDFGWGRPAHYSLVVNASYGDGVVFLLPSPQGGRHRRLAVALQQSAMDRLLQEPLFMALVSPSHINNGPISHKANGLHTNGSISHKANGLHSP